MVEETNILEDYSKILENHSNIKIEFPCGYKVKIERNIKEKINVDKLLAKFRECPLHKKKCFNFRVIGERKEW